MKTLFSLTAAFLLLSCRGNTQDQTELKTQQDSISYSIGMDIARNLKAQSIDLNPDALAQGMRDVLRDGQTRLTEEEAQAAMQSFQQQMIAGQEEKMKEAAERNREEGEAYCARNGKKEGVVTLPSGLQYRVIKAGAGPKPKATQTVTVHYRGTLVDGSEFDSSYKRGQPATFRVDGVIKGWTEALQLMPAGSKWELVIPAGLAYGERGAGQTIEPNETLVFEVELLSVK